MILTSVARERLKNMLSGDNRFRIEIQSGGCNGFEKIFSISPKQSDDIEIDNLVISDQVSWEFLENSILDFKTEISSFGFHLSIQDAASSCGCGKSFSV